MKFIQNLRIIFLLFLASSAFAQNKIPLTLSYAVSKTNYKAGDTLDFILNVKIKDGWYIYSTEFAADGPMKFECNADKSNDYKVVDTVRAYKPFSHYDDVWEGEVKIFEDIAQFRLKIVVKKSGPINFKATVLGQVCSDLCVPIEEKIDTDLSKLTFCDYKAADPSVYKHYQVVGEKK